MQKRPFGKTGMDVTALGFGAAPVGYLDTPQPEIDRLLNTLLDRGINLIDTAAGYRGSEEAIGKAVAQRRGEFILVSKCGYSLPGLPGEDWSRRLISETIDQSLRRLRTDHLDVMLLHSCSLEVLECGEVIDALVEAREAGKIRFAGYSGDNEAAAFAAAHPEMSVLQISINICDQHNIDHVLPTAREHGVGVMVKRPLANAAWKPPAEQPGMYADYARTYSDRLAAMGITPTSVYQDAGMPETVPPWAAFALRFALSFEGAHVAIIGTTRLENALSNIDAARDAPLPPGIVQRIRAAFQRAQNAAGATWRGET